MKNIFLLAKLKHTHVILKLRNVGKPFFERGCCFEVSVQSILGSNFRRRFHIIRAFLADDRFHTKDLHNTANSLYVNAVRKLVYLFTVNDDTHLSVSENTVAFLIEIFYIFRNLYVQKLAFALRSLFPLVIGRAIQLQNNTHFLDGITHMRI